MDFKELRNLYESYMSVYANTEEVKELNESDKYDLVLEYLLNEGFADTEENALVIMQNMSERWRTSILEDQKG